MTKKKRKHHLNIYCILLPALLIVSGCVGSKKKSELLGIQQKRIVKLEQQLKRKQKIIHKMKTERWVGKPIRTNPKIAFRPLKKHLKNKNWIQALKESASLKKRYPRSRELSRLRLKIFKRMGLSQQFKREKSYLRKLQISSIKKRSQRKNDRL